MEKHENNTCRMMVSKVIFFFFFFFLMRKPRNDETQSCKSQWVGQGRRAVSRPSTRQAAPILCPQPPCVLRFWRTHESAISSWSKDTSFLLSPLSIEKWWPGVWDFRLPFPIIKLPTPQCLSHKYISGSATLAYWRSSGMLTSLSLFLPMIPHYIAFSINIRRHPLTYHLLIFSPIRKTSYRQNLAPICLTSSKHISASRHWTIYCLPGP
jgi:hypothetical protein